MRVYLETITSSCRCNDWTFPVIHIVAVPPGGPWGPHTSLGTRAHLLLVLLLVGAVCACVKGSPGTPVEPLVLRCWQKRLLGCPDNTQESGSLRWGGKWHRKSDKWPSLRWKTTSTGCFLFCLFLYQVSVLFLFSFYWCYPAADPIWGPSTDRWMSCLMLASFSLK